MFVHHNKDAAKVFKKSFHFSRQTKILKRNEK